MSFISETITPTGGADLAAMSRGEPGLPPDFVWRGLSYPVGEIIASWKSTNPCQFNPKESYLRKHWYRFTTTGGQQMTVYFDRQPRNAASRRDRWVLYSLD
jgi:hypothetical protein